MSPAPTSFFCICNCNSMEQYIEQKCTAMNSLHSEFALHCIILSLNCALDLICSKILSITISPALNFFLLYSPSNYKYNSPPQYIEHNVLCTALCIVLYWNDGSCIHHFSWKLWDQQIIIIYIYIKIIMILVVAIRSILLLLCALSSASKSLVTKSLESTDEN